MEYSDDEEPKPSVRLSQAQKLRKVIIELVDTERSYVKVNMNHIHKLFFRREKKQTTKTKNRKQRFCTDNVVFPPKTFPPEI